MDELMDMIAADESPSQISDKIKDVLFAKSAEKVDAFRPAVTDSIFGDKAGYEADEADEVEEVENAEDQE